MKRFFHHFRFATFGIAILCTLLGLALLIWPEQSMNVLGYGFGAVLTISGLLQIGGYVASDKQGLLKKIQLLAGILIAVVGVAILLSPKTVMKLTVVVIGIVMLYHGVMDIKFGFDIKNCNGSKWAVTLLMGLVTCALGVLVDTDCSVKVAGGYLIQLLPGAPDEVIDRVEAGIRRAGAVTKMLDAGMTPEDILGQVCGELGVVFMETTEVSYKCYCSRQRVESALISLGHKELSEIAAEGKTFPVECQFCDTAYSFTPADIKELLEKI